MDAALIIATISLATSAITVGLWLGKAYDKYRNPQKYYHAKAEDIMHKAMGDQIDIEKTQAKLETQHNKLTYKQAKASWDRDRLSNWKTGDIRPKPKKKAYLELN